MHTPLFLDRTEAGRLLAARLAHLEEQDPLILGVPRGGVVVAFEVAAALRAPLDVMLARKIRAPDQPELAIGAVVGEEGIRLLDERAIYYLQVPDAYVEREANLQREEISRRLRLYRGHRPPAELSGRCLVLVDDGIATGYTLRAAIEGLSLRKPARLVVAVPVAPASVVDEMRSGGIEVVCLASPEPFMAVGIWYGQFDQNSDEEVTHLLDRSDAMLSNQPSF